MNKLVLDQVDVNNKRVLMRVDFNVPQNEDGSVREDMRIRAALKSIRYVLENGGKLVLMSHLGRPKDLSKAQNEEERAQMEKSNARLKMDPIAAKLSELLGIPVKKLDACVGPEVEAAVAAMKPGEVILLENTRFYKGETKNDPEFSAQLARLGDIYVSDAFGTVHRAHASTEGVTYHIKQSAAGFLVAKEMEYFSKVLDNPERPLAALLGGSKVSDKIKVIEHLLDLVDTLLIGGGMGGLIQELSAGPGIEVTYLEMDADAFQMAKEFVPSLATAKTIFQDGRRYLLQSQEHYDIIIVHAGRPSTALNNRFYTREFHQLASQRLTPTGVFALCGIPSGENVVGSELLHLNSALYQDLSTVFRHLLVIPGDAAHYFAANQSDILCMDPDSLIHRYRSLDRQDRYFHPHMFASLFMPERRTQFTQSLQQVQISNRDERPVSYLLDLLIWLKQVSGLSALGTTLRPPPILPLGFSVCLLIVLGVSIKKRSAATCQMIMFLSGLTSISLNLIFLLMLQSLYGYVYEGLGLAMAAYMAGMAITAAAVHKGHPSSTRALPVLLLGTMLFLILLMPAFRFFMNHSSLTLFFLVIIGGGALNGAVFPFLNALYLQHHAIAYGRIYAMDVLGAAVGSLMINSYAVPILGFSATLHWLAGFCALAWLGAQFSPGGDHL